MIRLLLVLATLTSCIGDNPEQTLRKKGRPEPFTCVKSGEGVMICIDRAGVVWACDGTSSTSDSKCVATGTLPPELR